MKAFLVFQLRRPPVKDSSPKLQGWPAHLFPDVPNLHWSPPGCRGRIAGKQGAGRVKGTCRQAHCK